MRTTKAKLPPKLRGFSVSWVTTPNTPSNRRGKEIILTGNSPCVLFLIISEVRSQQISLGKSGALDLISNKCEDLVNKYKYKLNLRKLVSGKCGP